MLSNNQLRVQKVQLCRTSVGNSCTKARSPLDHIIGIIFSLHTYHVNHGIKYAKYKDDRSRCQFMPSDAPYTNTVQS